MIFRTPEVYSASCPASSGPAPGPACTTYAAAPPGERKEQHELYGQTVNSVAGQVTIKRGEGGAPHLKDAENFILKGHITQHSGYMGKTNSNELMHMVVIYSKSLVRAIGKVFHMTFS